MYKFTIEYYHEKYHTGDINYNKTRAATVFAKDRESAISKIRLADNDYIGVAFMQFVECLDD